MLKREIDQIIIGKRVRHGISPLKKGFFGANIMGFDVEASGSEPYSMQFFTNEGGEFVWIKGLTEKELLEMVFERAKRGLNCVFAHNLEYDLGILFKDICYNKPTNFYGYRMKVIYPDSTFMKVTDKDNHKTIQFMDSMAFFQASLKKCAEQFNISVKKMEHPDCVKNGRFPTKAEMEYLKEYAIIDAHIAYELGYIILQWHEQYDVPITWTVSPATMASKIIRRTFLKDRIPYQHDWINSLGMRAYFGGRTESFIYGTTDCTVYDINSSYPKAFSDIAVPLERRWKKVEEFDGENGFYVISGFIPDMKISPLPMKSRLFYFPVGKFNNVVVTGYELKHILEYAKIDRLKGWVYIGKSCEAMKDFVYDFYKKKSEFKASGDRISYLFSKLNLNGGYGKLMQKNPLDFAERNVKVGSYDVETEELTMIEVSRRFEAGGMFNPVMAAWVTSCARANLYNFFKKCPDDVLYTDTDSLMVKGNPKICTGKKLGDLDFDTKGRATVIREKLYVINKDNEIVKTGKHGVWIPPEKMKEMISRKSSLRDKSAHYKLHRMSKLRESFRQKRSPFVFGEQDREISLAPSSKRSKPVGWKEFDYEHDFMFLRPLKLR